MSVVQAVESYVVRAGRHVRVEVAVERSEKGWRMASGWNQGCFGRHFVDAGVGDGRESRARPLVWSRPKHSPPL